jgi:hypothetical protein
MRNTTTRRPRENRTITVDFQNEATYCQLLGDGKTCVELVIAVVMALASPKPTVSPAKNSLMYFVSMGYIGHPVWGSHREEAKRGPPSGHRIPRNEGVMMSLLHPYATPGLSLIAGWCVIGATPRGQPRTPALILLHGCEGLRVRWMAVWWTFRWPFMGHPMPRQ